MKRRIVALIFAALFLTGCGAEQEQTAKRTEIIETETTHYVALTFDDGPSDKYTERLLDGLKDRGVHATFFVIGNLVECNEELVQRMAAEGHQVGNHSYDHAQLNRIQTAQALEDLQRCDDLLCRVLGQGTYWVRPPYGLISDVELSDVSAPLVCWSVDTRDWELKNVDQVLDIILRETGDGDIILMHDQYKTSVEAALRAVDRLTAQGVRFVTVEELFAIKAIEPECGALYRQAK
ncbi:MAG: polysaccharide deacetylase family protein [Clostridiales bacterium]|nr:polysaccharide deacetylase family protein [Candidatus Cacconaster stercorequi]